MQKTQPHFEFEDNLRAKGYNFIVGIDEVGRGPLAGPVVAAAVILPSCFKGINDSKKLSEKKRDKLAEIIKSQAVDYGIGEATCEQIDKLGLQSATFLAYNRAIGKLKNADFLLIDGLKWKQAPLPSTSIIKGDAICCSIAAASIIAKVYRDKLMTELHKDFPEYRFDLHKGYGTKLHLESLRKFGVSELHRKSFAPIKILL